MPESRDIYQCPQAAATLKYFRYSTAIFMNWSRTNCIYSYALALSPRPIYLSLQVGASVLIYALVINDAKRIRTYISHSMKHSHSHECDLQIRIRFTPHVSQSSHSQSFTLRACTFIHTNVKPQKRQSTEFYCLEPKKKKKLVSTQTLPHSLYAFAWCCCLCFLEHSVEREGREGVATRNIRNIIWIWLSEGGKGRASWAK